MKKVLVLGATGFVGLHVCEKLVRAGWQVSVATRRRSNARDIMWGVTEAFKATGVGGLDFLGHVLVDGGMGGGGHDV